PREPLEGIDALGCWSVVIVRFLSSLRVRSLTIRVFQRRAAPIARQLRSAAGATWMITWAQVFRSGSGGTTGRMSAEGRPDVRHTGVVGGHGEWLFPW